MMRRTRESGAVLVITLLVLLALTVLGMSTIFLTGVSNEIAINQRAGDQALYVAEAGVNLGIGMVIDDPALPQANYHTEGFNSGAETGLPADVTIKNGGSDATFPGGAVATAAIRIKESADARGQTISCGLIGYSERFGSMRFRVDSIGNGPGGSKRQVEAHVLMPPQEGICPPGTNVVGGYSGGGS